MAFKVKSVLDLCEAARRLGNGAASADAIAKLIAAAHAGDTIEELFNRMIAEARHDLARHKDPALQVERRARIAGLTGEKDDFDRAIGLIPEIKHPCARARAKGLVVQAYLDAGMTDKARDFARTIKSVFWGAEAWIGICRKSRNPYDLQRAVARCEGTEHTRGIQDPLAKEEVQAQIRALQ